jgi:hypothetical protein
VCVCLSVCFYVSFCLSSCLRSFPLFIAVQQGIRYKFSFFLNLIPTTLSMQGF